MADAFGTAAPAARKPYPWTEIFRCFQVALDPRKLAIAAAGILAMSLGWYVLSALFWHDDFNKSTAEHQKIVAGETSWKDKSPGEIQEEATKRAGADLENIKKKYIDLVKADKDFNKTKREDSEVFVEAERRYTKELNQYHFLKSLAGPGGRIRSMPWYENRGPNPYVFLTSLSTLPSSEWINSTWGYLKMQLPVMAEPLTKLFLPLIKFTDPNATTVTRLYLFFVMLWTVLVWAFAGGIITRIAAVQLSGKDRVSIGQACRFVCQRYLSYALSPVVPMGVIGAVVFGLIILGLICLIPWAGDFIYGILGIPLMIIGGIIMTILVIGLVGYPMMTSTLSTEGSDTFDALSRSYNYVFQSPWNYAWYWFVALLYGTVVTFFVVLVASLMVYLGKWAICQTPGTELTKQNQDYLFMYAPESFGWKELLLRGGALRGHQDALTQEYVFADPKAASDYTKSYLWSNWIGASLTTFWLVTIFLLMLGFSYSFFWSAATMIYMLMRQRVDEVELDEVYLEDEDVPPPPVVVPPVAPSGPASLPMVTDSPPPTMVPPPPVEPPSPPESTTKTP